MNLQQYWCAGFTVGFSVANDRVAGRLPGFFMTMENCTHPMRNSVQDRLGHEISLTDKRWHHICLVDPVRSLNPLWLTGYFRCPTLALDSHLWPRIPGWPMRSLARRPGLCGRGEGAHQ
jgi:hypothetical protein